MSPRSLNTGLADSKDLSNDFKVNIEPILDNPFKNKENAQNFVMGRSMSKHSELNINENIDSSKDRQPTDYQESQAKKKDLIAGYLDAAKGKLKLQTGLEKGFEQPEPTIKLITPNNHS